MLIMAFGITEVLNAWSQAGVFSYLLPFLLIFAVVFGILAKSGIFGDNKGVNGVVAFAIAALSLQFDLVSNFFASIFPRFGVGIGVFLVILVLVGLFVDFNKDGGNVALTAIGAIIAGLVVLWSLANWTFFGNYEFGFWLTEYFWTAVIVVVVVGGIVWIVKGSGSGSGEKKPE